MNIAIIGASGFLGRNLINFLLENTNHNICAIAPDSDKIIIEEKYQKRVNLMKVNAFNFTQIKIALTGVDIAFYFIHLLCQKENFYNKETKIAEIVGKALKDIRVKRVIYMSGLGNEKEKLSPHLLSRHKTGKILSQYVNQIIEFRASIIIGNGSTSFEIIKDLIHKSPIILLPKSSINKTQPILLEDILLYLISAISLPNKENLIIEVGGPEVMSYKKLLEKYRDSIKKKNPIIIISLLPEKIAGLFLHLFTSKRQAIIGKNMIKSFRNEMVVTNNKAIELFPKIKPQNIKKYFV